MFSLSSISFFATVALAAFSSAAPLVGSTIADTKAVTPSTDHALATRAPCDCVEQGVKSLVGIVVETTVKVKPVVAQLSAITKSDCTAEVVKPIVTDLCGILAEATAEVVALKKYSVSAVLKTADGVLSLADFCGLLAELINLILSAVGIVLGCLLELKGEVYELLCLVGVALYQLLHCIFEVLASVIIEVLAILCPLLAVNVWVIVKLHLVDLIAILKLKVVL